MSEVKHKPKVISLIARIAGFVTFSLGLLMVPYSCYCAITPMSEPYDWLISFYLFAPAIVSFEFFWLIAPISLLLSILPLVIERDIRHRVLPLAFVLTGIGLWVACYFLLTYNWSDAQATLIFPFSTVCKTR
ncbi:MAG: hypothetical protein GWN67_25515 [Phycisphaerae bacterium]|nr:hypothetical protein [Phycisphaerae bacterium]NIP52555.1 hypothetical protein [Phycisphaerae bacterium]NIS51539.1 hypothetical protein [Phycisphaerae bacterium]NIU09121.1 hypothetical protein [Phycisphaerae bacterium]NIU59621.1 hypothetical protein [Phycisphaerae bacterium]